MSANMTNKIVRSRSRGLRNDPKRILPTSSPDGRCPPQHTTSQRILPHGLYPTVSSWEYDWSTDENSENASSQTNVWEAIDREAFLHLQSVLEAEGAAEVSAERACRTTSSEERREGSILKRGPSIPSLASQKSVQFDLEMETCVYFVGGHTSTKDAGARSRRRWWTLAGEFTGRARFSNGINTYCAKLVIQN